jgi:hypothetical protein
MSPGLIDKYWFSVHTVVLGGGKPLFSDSKARIPLKLLNSTTFNSGGRWLLLRTDPVEYFGGSVHGGEIGQMEQEFCWEVLYNLYVLHVGA